MAESPTAREDGRHACHLQVSEESGSAIFVSGRLDVFLTLFFLSTIIKILLYSLEKNLLEFKVLQIMAA